MTTHKRVLIVDDEMGIRYFFRAVLEKEGFDCYEASCGEDALELLRNETFDLMTLDVRMPGIGGLDVLREVRGSGAGTSIVMVTALGDPEIAANSLNEAGADAFIGKPCSTEQILSVVDRICSAA